MSANCITDIERDAVPLTGKVRVNPDEIPDYVYDIASRVLDSSVRRFFALPGVQEEYEEWMKTEEGQLAELPPEERKQWLAAKQKQTPAEMQA